MKKVLNDFREFIMKGNVIDLAVGIIIGGGFNTIVTSLVNDILMPPIGLLLGDVNFSDFYVILKQGETSVAAHATLEKAQAAGAVTWNYGLFINSLISFLIIAIAVFVIIRGVNKMQQEVEKRAKKPETAVDEGTQEKTCPFCIQTIPLKATRCPYCTSKLKE